MFLIVLSVLFATQHSPCHHRLILAAHAVTAPTDNRSFAAPIGDFLPRQHHGTGRSGLALECERLYRVLSKLFLAFEFVPLWLAVPR